MVLLRIYQFDHIPGLNATAPAFNTGYVNKLHLIVEISQCLNELR